MVAPENLDLVVQVRVLAGQFDIYGKFSFDYFGCRSRDTYEI